MKNNFLIFFCFLLIGCTTTNIPSYIQNKNPYEKEFYADFDAVFKAAQESLKELGWEIVKTSDPSEYERFPVVENAGRQTLLFTEVRQTSMFIGSRYARINVYLREVSENSTTMEIRYLTVTSLVFKNFTNYKNDAAVTRLFDYIEKKLK